MKQELSIQEALSKLAQGKTVKLDLLDGQGEIKRKNGKYEVSMHKNGADKPNVLRGNIKLATSTLTASANKPYIEVSV